MIDLHEIEIFNLHVRTASLILDMAAGELFTDKVFHMLYELPKTVYCELRDVDGTPALKPVTTETLAALGQRCSQIVDQNIPIEKVTVDIDETALEYLRQRHRAKTISMSESISDPTFEACRIGDYYGVAIGDVLPSTGSVAPFCLIPYHNGFCVEFEGFEPSLESMTKLFELLLQRERWYNMIGVHGVGRLNQTANMGYVPQFINFCEAMHEREYANVADRIKASAHEKKIVFLAGPSSSGKTSSAKRIALQLAVIGIKPKVIELDNYFVDRDRTPRDAKGNFNFEALECLDLELLGNHLNALLRGEEIELPTFDFKNGVQKFLGAKMRLEENDVLIMEGIHALNPAMVPTIDQSRILRIFVAPMNSIVFDETNYVDSSDIRMIRRMVRDNRTRGFSPEATLKQWQSVREGEETNIYPYQENADIILNTSLPYELPVLKYYVEPLLKRIPHTSPARREVRRLLDFLNLISPITTDEMSAIPPQSIIREFIGDQILF